MADWCFEVHVVQSTHTIADPDKNARRWAKWDIVEIYPAESVGTKQGQSYTPLEPITMPRNGFLFVTGIPDSHPSVGNIDLPFLKRIFLQEWADVELVDGRLDGVLKRKRNFTSNALPNNVTNAIEADRYDTITYNQAKGYIFNKRSSRLFDEIQDMLNG